MEGQHGLPGLPRIPGIIERILVEEDDVVSLVLGEGADAEEIAARPLDSHDPCVHASQVMPPAEGGAVPGLIRTAGGAKPDVIGPQISWLVWHRSTGYTLRSRLIDWGRTEAETGVGAAPPFNHDRPWAPGSRREKKDETNKERKLRRKLEKKQRKLEQKLGTLEKKRRELKERHRKTAPKTTRKATRRVVAKPKKRTRAPAPRKAGAPSAMRPKRAPRGPSQPSPAALVSAVTTALAQKPPAIEDRGARERDEGDDRAERERGRAADSLAHGAAERGDAAEAHQDRAEDMHRGVLGVAIPPSGSSSTTAPTPLIPR
jgi:hypothetical protein